MFADFPVIKILSYSPPVSVSGCLDVIPTVSKGYMAHLFKGESASLYQQPSAAGYVGEDAKGELSALRWSAQLCSILGESRRTGTCLQ